MDAVDSRTQDHPPTVSRANAERAVEMLIRYCGEKPEREGLIETPRRVAKAYRELTAGYTTDIAAILSTQFAERTDEMVMVKGIPFTSLCEHHLLPFVGTMVVGYIPGEKVVGLSKIPRLVNAYAQRFQIQERLTRQIAESMQEHLAPQGVGVIVTAHHSCMSCRGVRVSGAQMITSHLIGLMKTDQRARAEFLKLATAP